MDKDCIKIFKALADKSRLLIITNLLEGSMYVELLSERLNLSPSTVSFHLKKLEECGIVYSAKEQYYVMYYINGEILNQTLANLISMGEPEKAVQEQREIEYRQSVIKSFFEYGKLKSIPVQQKKRKIVLEEIGKAFERERSYTEREINIIIADFHDDFCTIRRELVGFDILERENGIYKLKKESKEI